MGDSRGAGRSDAAGAGAAAVGGLGGDPYLRERLTLIDTRGDGDMDAQTTAVSAAVATEESAGQSERIEPGEGECGPFDAIVCVLDAQRIGSADDARHLAAAAARGTQLFIAVNKSELLDADLAEMEDDAEGDTVEEEDMVVPIKHH